MCVFSLIFVFLSFLFTIFTYITTTDIRAQVAMDGIFFENIIKLNGSKNFELWQMRVKNLFVQQGWVKGLSRKLPKGMKVANWKELEAKAASIIRHYLANEVLYHVMDEKSLAVI